jgi:hypothetical protein
VIENPKTYNNCKYVGVYYDRLNRIMYFNYIHLPNGTRHAATDLY